MNSASSEYDAEHYNPAAPIIEVGVAGIGSKSPITQLTALIDSGADATMLPIDVVQAAGGRYITTRQMRGVAGRVVVVEMYLATLFISPFIFPGIEVIALAANSEAIIGRDVLNQMIVTLNGLANVVELSQ